MCKEEVKKMTNKVAELEGKLLKVNGEIAKEREVERRKELAISAYSKLSQALRIALTAEERQAVDGMYLFLHVDLGSLSVDLVRNVPSASDKGQSEMPKVWRGDGGSASPQTHTGRLSDGVGRGLGVPQVWSHREGIGETGGDIPAVSRECRKGGD